MLTQKLGCHQTALKICVRNSWQNLISYCTLFATVKEECFFQLPGQNLQNISVVCVPSIYLDASRTCDSCMVRVGVPSWDQQVLNFVVGAIRI